MEVRGIRVMRWALVILTATAFTYGLVLLLAPAMLVTLQGADPVKGSWLRWGGGTLLGLGVGHILVYRRPRGQDVYILTLAIVTLLEGIGFLIALIAGETAGSAFFTILPMVISFASSAALWWSRGAAAEVLKAS